MQPRTSPTEQAITGLIVAVVIIFTLMCGLALALSEGAHTSAEVVPTPTLFHLATLTPSGPIRVPTSSATQAGPPILIMPTGVATEVITLSLLPIPTTTPTPTPTPTAPPVTGGCAIAPGWQVYRIQPGDTLFLIGLRYGLTVDGIMRGNCLTDTVIVAGSVLYVPPVTPFAVDTSQAILTTTLNPSQPAIRPTTTGTQTATDGACTNPDSIIRSPKVGQIITGTIPITGTARVPNFAFYKIEIRQEGTPMTYANLFTGTQEVNGGTLATLTTSIWPNGEYWLRLVVVDQLSNYPERCALLVTFRNP